MKKLLSIIALLGLVSCSSFGPEPLFMSTNIPGPPEYKAGWKDGCESGYATYAPAHYKMWYAYYQNYGMLKNPQYNAGWHEAFDYCRHYSLRWNSHDLYQGIVY